MVSVNAVVVYHFTHYYILHAQIPGNTDTEELLSLNPDRIGHGTFLHPENGGKQSSIDFIIHNKIPIGEPRHPFITYVCYMMSICTSLCV